MPENDRKNLDISKSLEHFVDLDESSTNNGATQLAAIDSLMQQLIALTTATAARQKQVEEESGARQKQVEVEAAARQKQMEQILAARQKQMEEANAARQEQTEALIANLQQANYKQMQKLEQKLEARSFPPQPGFNSTGLNSSPVFHAQTAQQSRTSLSSDQNILNTASGGLNFNSVNSEQAPFNGSNNDSLMAIANLTVRAQLKEEHKTLPQVTEQGYQWLIFYRAFLATKGYFSAAENVDRIKKALLEPTWKQHDAVSIIAETYEQTLAQMHEIFYNPDVIIINSMETLFKSRPNQKLPQHSIKNYYYTFL